MVEGQTLKQENLGILEALWYSLLGALFMILISNLHGPKDSCFWWDARWRHLENMMDQSMQRRCCSLMQLVIIYCLKWHQWSGFVMLHRKRTFDVDEEISETTKKKRQKTQQQQSSAKQELRHFTDWWNRLSDMLLGPWRSYWQILSDFGFFLQCSLIWLGVRFFVGYSLRLLGEPHHISWSKVNDVLHGESICVHQQCVQAIWAGYRAQTCFVFLQLLLLIGQFFIEN